MTSLNVTWLPGVRNDDADAISVEGSEGRFE
jgi:hypothetical protein